MGQLIPSVMEVASQPISSVIEALRAAKVKEDNLPSPEHTAHARSVVTTIPNTIAYLGGSRAFAEMAELAGVTMVLKPETDWDYYATHSHAAERHLLDHGFNYTDSGYDLDDEAVCILRDANVEIVLRRDAEFYKCVIESIPPQLYIDWLWKSTPRGIDRRTIQPIFNMLFAVAHGFEEKSRLK